MYKYQKTVAMPDGFKILADRLTEDELQGMFAPADVDFTGWNWAIPYTYSYHEGENYITIIIKKETTL